MFVMDVNPAKVRDIEHNFEQMTSALLAKQEMVISTSNEQMREQQSF